MNPHTKLNWKKYHPPVEAVEVLTHCKRLIIANTAKELIDLACGGPQSNNFEVAYDVSGKGRIVEATVARVRNGVAANYIFGAANAGAACRIKWLKAARTMP